METKEAVIELGAPFIIANPIYDTVFKRLMENQRIAKFFLGTILEQQIEDLTVMPQEFTYKKIDETKVPSESGKKEKKKKKAKEKKGEETYSIFRLDFMATVRDADDKPSRKILIELQKSWDTQDVMRFRKYLGEQYIRVDAVDGKEISLPITTIYILGNNLAETDCPCIKVGRTYTDMINRTTINAKSKFIENLTHDSYVIQAGRITDVRYTTNLDKLLSIFEQRYFIKAGSDVRKEYRYQPDDENMTLITNLLYKMGADPKECKQIEDEEEFLRVLNNAKNEATREKDKIIEELTETNRNLSGTVEELTESNKYLSGTVEELTETNKYLSGTVEEQDKTIKNLSGAVEEQDKTIKEQDKTIKNLSGTVEELTKKMENLERLFRER